MATGIYNAFIFWVVMHQAIEEYNNARKDPELAKQMKQLIFRDPSEITIDKRSPLAQQKHKVTILAIPYVKFIHLIVTILEMPLCQIHTSHSHYT
jgi:hypothetical protein